MPAPPFRGGILRKYYIDNLRSLCILLLFPYHTCMVFNDFESFYVHGVTVRLFSDFVLACSQWFMPLMFVLAGVSTAYALQKRTTREYIGERAARLLLPLVFGLLLVVPAQTYFAERFHNGYTGGYFEQYLLFFTKPTDLTGYKGGFTPAHLWFIFYLFVIALLAMPILLWYNKREKPLDAARLTIPKLLPLVLIPYVMSPILDISGKSLGQFFALFMLGYFVLSRSEVIERLERYRWPLTGATVLLLAVTLVVFRLGGWQDGFSPAALSLSLGRHITMWVSILAIMGMGKRYLNFTNCASAYFARASFPVYVFHQTWIIVAAYYALQLTDNVALQALIILISGFVLSMATYEAARRFFVIRWMFGIKNNTINTKEKLS